MKMQSIRLKLQFAMVSIVLIMFMMLFVPFMVVYKDYFIYQQQDLLVSVNAGMKYNLSLEDFLKQCFLYETRDNVNYIIIEKLSDSILYTTSHIDDKRDYTYKELYMGQPGLDIKNIRYEMEKPYILTNVVSNMSNTESIHLISEKIIDNKTYIVIIEKSIANVTDSVRGIFFFLLMFIIPIAFIACFVISRVSVYFILPIEEISRKTKDLANFNFKSKITLNTNDEIGLLAQNINKLSEELEHKLNELEQKNETLKESLAEKDKNSKIQEEFIANVSHELKTPITLILGYSEALRLGIDEESEAEYTDIIIDESHKMNELISSLLDMAKLKSGNASLAVHEFDLLPMLWNVETKYQLLFHEKGIEFNSGVKDEELLVIGDRVKLELVLTNYIVNAIRYVDDNKKISLNILDEGEYVNIEIFNSSPPIKQEDLDRIWGSFYKIDKAHTREKGGTGVGLYIVKTIMELHGYECGVRNVDGGVIFFFKIKKAG